MSSGVRSGKKRKASSSAAVTKSKYRKSGARYLKGITPATDIQLTYCDSRVLTSSAGNSVSYVYRLNSVFDPDYTGTGSQPLGFDNMALLYGRYRVDKAVVELKAVTGNATAGILSMAVRNDLTSDATYTDNLASIASGDAAWDVFSASYNKMTLKKTVDLARLTGIAKTSYKADDRFQAVVTSSPSETLGLCVSATQQGGAASTVVVAYTIKITYYCHFFDHVKLPLS